MKQKNMAWEISEIVIIAIILALTVRFFAVQAYKIPSGSMLNTLQIGDYLLVTRFNYAIKIPFTNKEIFRIGDPQHGDIIVFEYPRNPSQDYIKRVIGVPGDVIEMRDKQLFRNGKHIKEPYVRIVKPWSRVPGMDSFGPVTVPADHYFTLGDNRDESADSREWGFVPRRNIQGKAWLIYWSWDSPATSLRWNRLGSFLYPDAAARGE